MLKKTRKKKVLRRTYAIGYSNNVMSAHSLIDSKFDEYFEEVQQHLKLVIKIKNERPFKLKTLRKPKEATKFGSKDIEKA